jgi:hypothetical protein
MAPAGEDALRDLQRMAGNKAVADALSGQGTAQHSEPTPALRLRDSLRAERAPLPREFGLAVQRLASESLELRRLLRIGSRGEDVMVLQDKLGVGADGIFGPATHAAVVAFQKSAGLAADGIVGRMTWSALGGSTSDAIGGGKGGTPGGGPTAKSGSESTTKSGGVGSVGKLGSESTTKSGGVGSTDKLGSESTTKGGSSGSTDTGKAGWETETGKL